MNLVTEAEKAIQTFYHSQNPEERNQAHRWLLELQKSPEAWQTSWLLLDTAKTVECQYYGAVILHYKISHMINEITEKEILEIQMKLISLICVYGSTLKFVRTKLCSTFAALVLQNLDNGATLLGCIEQVGLYLHSVGSESKEITLQIISELPSQLNSINMPQSERFKAKDFMMKFVDPLISMWKEIFLSKNINLQADALPTMLGWIEFGIPAIDFVPMIPILLHHIEVDELSPKICEVITDALTEPSSYSLKETIFQMINQILQLEPLVERAIIEQNEEFVNNFCMMISNIGETHSNILLATNDPSFQKVSLDLIKLILRFSSVSGHFPVDESCSKLTLTFWYHLQDDLYSIETITDYHRQVYDAFLVLIDIYFLKAQYPPDETYEKFNSEEKEQFRCYRIDIQDTIMYLNNALRQRCLSYFIEKLTSLLSSE